MATSNENDDFPTISKTFDDQLQKCFEIENTVLSTTDEELQNKISSTIKILEELTINISYLGVFSTNEAIEEISTNSLKFMMLPVLLGSLTLKLLKQPREEALEMASVYFKDFLKRCFHYQLTSNPNINDEEKNASENGPKISPSGRPTPEELRMMSKQRENKIARYKEKKALEEKLCELKKAIENPSRDEEVIREYYITLINQFINQSLDELDSINMELSMLQKMKQINISQEKTPAQKTSPKLFRPFLITKDAAQKKVFGAGYPSLPVMSVDEFYEQRVKEGWFPPRSQSHSKDSKAAAKEAKEGDKEEEEHDEDENVERLRERDEWRDTHRTGWGNTYNRS
ncbi:UNVERIFIED_CONTAM: hypothetical protein GTU68_039531 [Idotea baltica]|nr:hypothetical protein [Idotea baltica]